MPVNRKNRVTVKKKMFNRKVFTLNKGGVISSKILLDDENFPAEIIILTDGEQIIKNNSANGCTCRKCGNFNEYAEPNQQDGTFVCFGCKSGL